MRTQNLARLTALATAGAASAALAMAGDVAHAAHPDPECADSTSTSWDCLRWTDPTDGDSGGVSVGAKMLHPTALRDHYTATFKAKGETLTVTDSYADGKEAVAYLKVEGSGTARFDNHHSKSYPLSFSEGKQVWIKVGIEGTDNWTKWSPAGRT